MGRRKMQKCEGEEKESNCNFKKIEGYILAYERKAVFQK